MLLQPFAVAKTPYVESEPTLLMELTPAPVNKLVCVLPVRFSSLSVTTTLAVATPVAFAGGENLTVIGQLAPTATLLQVSDSVKYVGFVPATLIEEISSGAVPFGFDIFTVCGPLIVPPC
jgi:hypothetical protein